MSKSREDEFLDAMSAWLQGRGFQVAGQWHAVDVKQDVLLAKVAARAAKVLTQALLGAKVRGVPVAGGADEKAIAKAMEPLIPVSDLLAVQLPGLSVSKSNSLVAVILADGLSPQEITSRFAVMMNHAGPVARLGMRVSYQSLGIMVHPLIVYADSRAYARNASLVLKHGWEVRAWQKISLKAAVIDLQGKRIEWAQKTGLARIGSMLGVKHEPFTERDLQELLKDS